MALAVLLPQTLWAAPKERPKAERDSVLFHGMYLGVDLAQVEQLLVNDRGGLNLTIDVNLRNRFEPLIDAGYARADLANESGTSCQVAGLYGKLGVNVPIATYGPDAEEQFFVGVRYGLSSFSYDIQGAVFPEGYWNPSYTADFRSEHAMAHFLELSGGMRMHLLGPVYMGWTFKIKKKMGLGSSQRATPPYIPGYGFADDSNFNFGVNLYYRFPW